MTNPLQRNRQDSIVMVKKTIAKSMPDGSKEAQLRAYLSIHNGFSNKAVTEYLSVLENAGDIEQIEVSAEVKVWKMLPKR